LIREGYRGVRFDAVLACDNDALEFTKKHRDELFPGLPVVFSSINDFDERMLEGRRDITGTSENTDYAGTIKAALRLFPATKNVVVVIDGTTTGKAHHSAVEKIRPYFPETLSFTYLSLADMTMEELAGKLSKLDRDSIVLLLQHFKDREGTSYTVQESTPLLTKSSSVPVFVLTDIRIGLGALGGHVVSGYHHGEAAAQMVSRILKGADVKSIPVLLDSPNRYMFDYSVMQRFKISENDLPQGSILVNKPVSLRDKYRPYLFAIVGAFIVLSAFVAYLLLEIRRRKKIEVSLEVANEKLQEQYEELEVNEESLRDQNDELLSIHEMLRVQINEYEVSQKLLKERDAELWSEKAFLRNLIDSADDLIYFKDSKGIYLGCNRASEAFTGYPEHEQTGKTDFDLFDREMAEQIVWHDQKVLEGSVAVHAEEWVISATGSRLLLDTVKTPIYGEDGKPMGLVGISRDITERKRTEEERGKLEGQLQHAQKMESVGRLAGGVAHDFNNMLSVILGHAHLALMEPELSKRLHDSLEEISKAAERSADLTKQLLAFARKQDISPKVLDLNKTVSGMLKMLERLLGEDMHLSWKAAPDLWQVNMDPSQIDQILANLCVNARDSIADVGNISIETGNSFIDEEYCANHAGFSKGEYVRLSVSDDGCGMDKETLTHIFEPFFTTKGVGEGTGLGLATVYGIVKQNKGFINVYSEPDWGTTFTIYFPRYLAEVADSENELDAVPVQSGHETILLVEDELAILKITSMILIRQGYTVLTANSPDEAIRLAGEQTSEIHLLMTDVIMPEMNGMDLAKTLLSSRPHLKCLFMSGYTSNVIAHHGVLNEGVHFIHKPFSFPDLAAKMREVLDS
jgi:PAS domain S-box-containing protein